MKRHAFFLLAVAPFTLLAAESNPPATAPAAETATNLASLVKFDFPTFEVIKLDQKPVIKVQVAPQYPTEMRRAEIEGEVLVDFVVTSEGNVVKASALSSSHREFETAAVIAVSKWKFAPGKKSGKPVNTHMQVPIGFAL